MKIEIPNHEDSIHIKNLVTMAFDKPERVNLLGFITDEGSFVVMKYDKEDKLQRHIVREYFEDMVMNKGDNACWDDFRLIMDEIERGD